MTAGGDPDGAPRLMLATVLIVGLLVVAVFFQAPRGHPCGWRLWTPAGRSPAWSRSRSRGSSPRRAAQTNSAVWSGVRAALTLLLGLALAPARRG
jgi:hypothetical protein